MLGQETEIQSMNNESDTQHISSRCHDILPSVMIRKIWAKKVSKAAWKLEDQYLEQFGRKMSEYTKIGKTVYQNCSGIQADPSQKRQSDCTNNKGTTSSIDTNHSSA